MTSVLMESAADVLSKLITELVLNISKPGILDLPSPILYELETDHDLNLVVCTAVSYDKLVPGYRYVSVS